MTVPARERREVSVRGIVQGVGFRPFVYALARKYDLSGTVRNDAEGVRIEVEGAPGELERFLRSLQDDAPPLAVVESVHWQPLAAIWEREFRIAPSREGLRRQALVSPDVATCEDCLAELLDPEDRRYRYPFTNCTNCGPRFTITRSLPYDRATTTMSGFTMCLACRNEYDDPSDRRFHAQPNACPVCGPRLLLLDRFGHELHAKPEDPIERAARMLRGRAVVAIKGLGGYHLACDPFDEKAVRTLRGRKVRQDKPFALMASDLAQAREICHLSPEEEALLASPACPIVLLGRRENSGVAEEVAPRQKTLGVMLAYTPLHHLLLRDAGIPLVMTSGNNSDEPIAYRDDEAFDQLCEIADYFLVHDREIHMRCDDTVVRTAGSRPYPIRRSRGYAPAPLRLADSVTRHTLACGGELKNTFCLARDRHAFLSHHIGDMENYETLRSFREGIEHYCRLFDVTPELVAYDLHPEYLSTKHAEDLGLSLVGVQHHHAHLAAVLAEHGVERGAGAIYDGTGYGTDGTVWGGELLHGDLLGFERIGALWPVRMPGGEAAIREPWRMACAWLVEAGLDVPPEWEQVAQLARTGFASPVTTSMGRLFDAVAAVCGIRQTVTYEGQAAIELEAAADRRERAAYPLPLAAGAAPLVLDARDTIAAVVRDVARGVDVALVAARFHNAVADATAEALRDEPIVVLSGGVFQNALLLERTRERLPRALVPAKLPVNDGAISYGQAAIAAACG